jgi:aspartokinase/homoserine dehydrogenase 1
MLVQKFGGTSLADIDGFNASADVIERHAGDTQLVVVLSAIKGVTDLLTEAIAAAERDESFEQALNEVISLEAAVVTDLGNAGVGSEESRKDVEKHQRRLQSRLEGIRLLGSCPDEARAEILASGERFSSRLMSRILRHRGLRAKWSDTDVLPPANDDILDSMVDQEAAAPLLREALTTDVQVLVLPGFYSRNPEGRYQLLGRNGSDYSAAAAAAALCADTCQIWKDVDGFFTADPRIVRNARCLEEVSFEEAMELSYFGAKVISSKALAPLAASGIPCEVRNTYKPDEPGTRVLMETSESSIVRGLSLLDHVASITLQGSGMRGRVGIARRVMDALASKSISILLIVQSSSEYSITLCVRTQEAERARRALEEEFHFECLHELISDISMQPERAVISLVGGGMKHYKGIAARFLTAISSAGANVEIIAQGSTECAIAVVVAREDATSATRACHTAFFSHTHHIDVILLGCGNVGSALLEQIQRQARDLASSHMQLNVRAIANSRKLLVSPHSVNLENWREALAEQGGPYTLDDVVAIREQLGLLNPTIVDCTTDEKLAGKYAHFLDRGFNVVAANKKANTSSMDYYRKMRETAAHTFRKFLYETNVGAGLPVIDTLHALIRSGDKLATFEGILSGSLSMIFGLLEDGMPFSQAVEKAMQMGFTEPDPREDLSGMDVARKLLIIAREVGLELELEDITIEAVIPEGFAADKDVLELVSELTQLDGLIEERVKLASYEGGVLRYVGRIDGRQCRVSIEAVSSGKPLAAIRDGENALVLHTRYYQPIPLVLRGYGAGAEVTAAGVFADLLRTAWRPLDQ